MSTETKAVMVSLKSTPGTKDGKPKTQKFEIERANRLLKIKKSAWKLDDPKFTFNGTEIAKAK
jgi:hypothetical protein